MNSSHERLVNTGQLKGRIAEALPLSAVAEALGVELFPSGHQMKGCCPIHQEDTPSFYVNDGKGLFHCFGCKAGGDSIALVREVKHQSFIDALVWLADEAEIDIDEYTRPPTPEELARDELRAWSEQWLANTKHKPDISRVDGATAQAFGVIDADSRVATRVPPALGDKHYLLQGVVFPYRMPNGRLVGWKTRHADGKQFMTPKDFPLTATTLFGIDGADLSEGTLVLVEGEYDCLVLHDHGATNVAALGGSKLTDEHIDLLKDLKLKRVVFLLDGDEPGRGAALTIAKQLWDVREFQVRINVCMPGSDPEDVVRTLGRGAFRSLVDGARGALEYVLWNEFSAQPRISMSDKLDFVRYVQQEYGRHLVGAQLAVTLGELALWLGLPQADVLDFAKAEKTQLQNIESERVVLGKSMRDRGYYLLARKQIVRDDFFVTKHQRIWAVMEEMLAEGLDFEPTVVRQRAEQQGVDPEYIELLASTGDLNIGWHEDQVVDLSVRRSSQLDANRFGELVADTSFPVSQLIGTLTHQVTSKALGRGSGAFTAISSQVDEAMETLHERMKNPNEVHGLSLGEQFPLLTRNLQGLQPRRLVLVAATSGAGKSTLGLQMMVALGVGRAIPCDFVSLEMDTDEILFKMASHITGIDSMKIMGGLLEPPEAVKVEQAMVRLRKSPIRIYAPDGITTNEFVLYARESVMERRTEVFMLDYAQMVGPDPAMKNVSKYEHLGDFAYTCKRLARGLDVTVVAMAQLKREAARSEKPTPEDMGDSYELVRAADVILLINEDEDRGLSEIWIGKNRQGPGNQAINIQFDKPNNTFREGGGAREPLYRIT